MERKPTGPKPKNDIRNSSTLRQRVLTFVGLLIVLSLIGSSVTLYRITEVNSSLDTINRVSVPLGKLVTQVQSDADVYRRELDRSLGYQHWKDNRWHARIVPPWIDEILDSELGQISKLLNDRAEWADSETQDHWRAWSNATILHLQGVRAEARDIVAALEKGDQAKAEELYPKWTANVEEWHRELQWGATEYDRALRQTFALAENRVAELRMGLETALVIVVCLSLLLLWLAERALRPLADLTTLARQIAQRGLRKEDKAILPDISLGRKDEVSQLAREFRGMATALLEREKVVESQNERLETQNHLLTKMGGLNENILKSIESILLVTDLEGMITQANPVALRWLGLTLERVQSSNVKSFPRISNFLKNFNFTAEVQRIEPTLLGERIYGGRVMPLRSADGVSSGWIIIVDDLTEELSIQERLRQAENLAAMGRLSAQVAHEVRNPLHSIGLETELAQEIAAKVGNVDLKQSLQSIQASVERLEKITGNYLKLSRLSTGIKLTFDLGDILETVLATYAPACEAQQVRVDWARSSGQSLSTFGDPELVEQALGNLMRNSLQALETHQSGAGKITWALGSSQGKVWIRIEDNGPGVSSDIRERLFTPFLTTRAQGTGLGLSFAKKVIQDHQGTLEYRTSSTGGACFEIRMPNYLQSEKDREKNRKKDRKKDRKEEMTHEL